MGEIIAIASGTWKNILRMNWDHKNRYAHLTRDLVVLADQ